MTKDEFCEALRVHIAIKHKRQAVAAKEWGVSEAYVSQVLRGKKSPTEAMLSDSGFKIVKTEPRYVKVRKK